MKTHFLSGLLLWSLSSFAVADLVETPHPVLDEYKPEIRAMLASARGRFELMALSATGPELGVAYGRLGLHYYAHAEQAAARACFLNAAQLDPDNFRWPYYLAVHYTETGDFVQAVQAFERVLALRAGDVPALTRLGLAQLELNRSDEARLNLQKALDNDPANAAALVGLARAAENRDQWANAVEFYQKALALQPEATQLHYRLGQAYRRIGEIDKARSELEQRGPRIASLNDPLLQFMNAHSKPAGYYVVLGDRAIGEGKAERAWKLFDLAYAIDPLHAGALVGMARIAFVNGREQEARLLADRALASTPDYWGALQLKGLIEQQAGDDTAAVDYFKRSLAMRDFPQTRVFLGNAYMNMRRYAQAAAQYGSVAEDESASAELLYRAGMAQIAAGNCPAAEPHLLSAYQKDPMLAKVVQALARIYSTCLEATPEQQATALGYAQLLYEGQPGLETAETLAMTYAAGARFDDAVDFQTQAIFEALKSGAIDRQPQLQENLERYRDQRPAVLPWPAGHAVFSPPRDTNGI